jgi:aminoglycoside phosphotransferase (APT) family kinase protein
MPAPTQPTLPALSDKWRHAFDWVEECVGGTIIGAERQARWRPAWFLTVELANGTGQRELYFRGERGEVENSFAALEQEAAVLQQLEADGIPVPHVFGLCPKPGGIVMARDRGRANLATADSDEQRHAVLADYIDVLVKMHGLDTAPYQALGLSTCKDEESLGLGDFHSWVSSFRARKTRPEPCIEFLIGWILRNVPTDRTRSSFLCADSGQFLYEGERVTSIIDLELAYVGDPAADLGALRCRDLSEPLGDIQAAIDRYAAKSKTSVPRSVLDFHTVRFAACTPLAVAPMVAQALPGLDYIQYLIWYVVYSRTPLEVIAAAREIPLEDITPPSAQANRSSPAYESLRLMLADKPKDEGEFQTYQRETSLRVAEYLARVDQFAAGFEDANRNDLKALLGKVPSDPLEADAALEKFVTEAGDQDEIRLIQILHRRLQREEFLLEPVMREFSGARMQASR